MEWSNISKQQNLSKEFIEEYKHQIEWKCLSATYPIDEAFALQYKDFIDWTEICINPCCTEEIIERFQEEIDWKTLSRCGNVSLAFVEKHASRIYLGVLGFNRYLQISDEEFDRIRDLKELKNPFIKISIKRQKSV